MTGRPLNEDRQLALLSGDKTYIGSPHDRCGTNVRYVKSGGCVRCARVIATEQREARKYLINQNGEVPQNSVDKSVPDEVPVEDDAAARSRAAIDDLM